MVQFGKTLNDVVKSDWRCHAVAYMELKRALSESHPNPCNITSDCGADGPCAGVDSKCGINGVNGCVDPAAKNNNNNDDADSVHTESSYCISDGQKANFFRIYEDSIRRLTNFYENRAQWAKEESGELEKAVGRRISEDEKAKANKNEGAHPGRVTEDTQSSSSSSFLIHQITNFSRDLGLVLEFLELNVTAFSKIMKKFDKRTGSNLREAKVKEMKAQHPHLYDGGELKKCKKNCAEWTKQLQLILQKDSNMLGGYLKGHFSSTTSSSSLEAGRVSISLQNSLSRGGREKAVKLVQNDEAINDCDDENPQESSEVKKTTPSVSFEEDNQNNRTRHSQPAPRSIHRTKDSQILQKMIDRVNEELCLQKADSPFFDGALEQTPPPSFMSSEVELAGELGRGEFCKIYEVSRFNVPEGCHICFLHRGYNDPDPSAKSPKKAIHRKIPSTVIANLPDISGEDGDPQPSATKNEQVMTVCQPTEITNPKLLSTFSFNYDANISDYDDLESDHEEDGYDHTTRGFMKDHCLRNGESRYAIKRIRSCLVGQEEITDAAIDLAREAEFLAALQHPNIIKSRGTINVPGHPKYSLILDRLYDTLEVQMKKWEVEIKRYQGRFKGLIGKNKMMLNKMWMERLVAAYDLARAMAYLHSRGVLHRDIKPANIGFDIRGDIKIFDFGLAKELKPIEREGQDQYHTSGLAGTRRYMAPEVAQVMPYGLSSDVYSFGILIWEMLTLKAAFEKYTREKHYKVRLFSLFIAVTPTISVAYQSAPLLTGLTK